MYALILVLTLTNLSEVRTFFSPYYSDISVICEIIGALSIVVGFMHYSRRIIQKPSKPKDAEALVQYNKYFTEKELENLNVPYVQRIENNIKRNVIEDATDFLNSSEQVLIISGESGVGKTRLAVEISKRINNSEKLTEDFKFKGKCLFVNLRHYKDPKDIEEKLDAELSEKTVLIFDDYQYNMDLFSEVKNNAFRRNSKLIITTRPIFIESLKEKIGEASIRELKLGRMEIHGILQDLKDIDLKREIEKISEGNPAIALLALDYIYQFPGRSAKSIFQDIRTSEEFFDKIIRDFQKEYGKDFIEFLAGRELSGGVTDIPQKYEKAMIELESNGHIVNTESKYHLTPEVLLEYLINSKFFSGTILKKSFEQLAKKDDGFYIPEIINSILKIKDERKIYWKATEELLEIIDKIEQNIGQKNRRIKTGIMVYDGFGNLNLVTERLGEFWTDYEILEDGNSLLDLGSFLIKISKPYEARKCLEKAKEIFTINSNKSGVAYSLYNLGIIYYDQGNHKEAVNLYTQSLEINREMGDKSGISDSLRRLGLIYHDQGNYEKGVKLYTQSLKIAEELGDKRRIAYSLNNLGSVCREQGNYGEAVNLYNQSLKLKKELRDKRGIAYSLHNLGSVYREQGDYGEAVNFYDQSLKIKKELEDKRGIADSLHNLGRIYEEKNEEILAILNYLEALSIYTELNSPESQSTSESISKIRDKIGEEEFKKALNKFGFTLLDE